MKGTVWIVAVLAGLVLGAACRSSSNTATTTSKESEVIAIDLALLPGGPALSTSLAANRTLLDTYPEGFKLNGEYRAHISMLQMFTTQEQLGALESEVGRLVDSGDLSIPVSGLRTSAYSQGPVFSQSGETLPKIPVDATAELSNIQNKLIAATRPFAVDDGTAAAFRVTPANEQESAKTGQPAITEATVGWVTNYLSVEAGAEFTPHITVGVADKSAWEKLATNQIEPMTFEATSLAVCHIGNYGTCHKILKAWP